MRKAKKRNHPAKYVCLSAAALLLVLSHTKVHGEDMLLERGECGPYAEYLGYDTNGDSVADKLVITGEGPIWDWSILNLWYQRDNHETELAAETVIIEDGITQIGLCEGGMADNPDGAFSGFRKMKRITIPDSVTAIGGRTFRGCESLTDISIPDSVKTIKFGAFQGCESLTDITIPEGVTALEDDLFNGCTKLASLSIPDSVTSIGKRTFASTSLSAVTIPGGVISIGNYAFDHCLKLDSVSIPGSVVSIGDHAFEYCPNLKSVTILNSQCTIGERALGFLHDIYWISGDTWDDSGLVEGFTIYGYTDSDAERYVKEIRDLSHTERISFIALASNWQGPYWYEDGMKQGVRYNEDGTLDLSYRGKEIFDPSTNAWYWLDSVQDGAVARSKDVYQESAAGEWAESPDGTGKWVRYDKDGHMVKGWDENEKGRYYFDPQYGTMAKGYVTLGDIEYYFNMETGVCERSMQVPEHGLAEVDNKTVFFQGYKRQGYSAHNKDYRGKEISYGGPWYWLDNANDGAIARSKDVYHPMSGAEGMEVHTVPTEGKWVRYNADGVMMRGWVAGKGENAEELGFYSNGKYLIPFELAEGRDLYFFDTWTGAMAKGDLVLDGITYHFDEMTGILDTSIN